jgi:hypothetical protein
LVFERSKKKFNLTKYFIKNSRNLFTWNRKLSNDCRQLNDQKFAKNLSYLGKKCSNNTNSKSTTNKEEQTINLIAAKLLSENIDIAQEPYTDEVFDIIFNLPVLIDFYFFLFFFIDGILQNTFCINQTLCMRTKAVC